MYLIPSIPHDMKGKSLLIISSCMPTWRVGGLSK